MEEMINRLELHGVRTSRSLRDTVIMVSAYRFKNPKWQQIPYEGHHVMSNIEYDEITESRFIPAGSAIVMTNQQGGGSSLISLNRKAAGPWCTGGILMLYLSRRNTLKNYVLEELAEKMLREDPGLVKQLDARKVSDTAFAKSSQQVLNWFYNKSPYIDNRKGMYPVCKIYDPAVVRDLLKQR